MRVDWVEMADKDWHEFAALFSPENQLSLPTDSRRLGSAGGEAKVFDTFDPEDVAELLQRLASSTYPIVADALSAPTQDHRKAAVITFERRLRLHGVAVDRSWACQTEV
jgi:hypothetical protein